MAQHSLPNIRLGRGPRDQGGGLVCFILILRGCSAGRIWGRRRCHLFFDHRAKPRNRPSSVMGRSLGSLFVPVEPPSPPPNPSAASGASLAGLGRGTAHRQGARLTWAGWAGPGVRGWVVSGVGLRVLQGAPCAPGETFKSVEACPGRGCGLSLTRTELSPERNYWVHLLSLFPGGQTTGRTSGEVSVGPQGASLPGFSPSLL